MAISVFDSGLYRNMFGTEAMRQIFSDAAYLARCVEAEVALARAQARLGVIPTAAAEAIAAHARADTLDIDTLQHETNIVGYPILPLLHQLTVQCGEAGGYLHWGATTQDIMDTATVLQVRAGLDLIGQELDAVRAALVVLAKRYRDTEMAGRTHLQQALPVTFGYKAAVWLSGLDRHAERLQALRPRVLMVQFGGAAGTLASLGEGDEGLRVRAEMARELGLGEPPITWHVARDGLAEAVQFLALVGGTLGKIALDVMIMASTEFGELAEPFVHGRGASSTMPQKRNPISSELMLAASKVLREKAGLMLDAMVQDFERATGPWHLEWVALPESFVAASSALHQARFMLEGLVVDEGRMRRNLNATNGLIVAEAVMMGLAPHIGRQEAHDVVYDACRKAIEGGGDILPILEAQPGIVGPLGRERLAQLCDPSNYVGASGLMVDRVLAGRG
ncbi:MAG: adenylosuccinate lyase family protein [Acetobacteraceae bacterium]